MKSTFGHNIRISIWGGSHEPAVGVDIAGLPLGTEINIMELTDFLKRRAPGNSSFATKRKEPDIPIPTKGLAQLSKDILTVTESLISFEIKNNDTRSSDYKNQRNIPRPGHADYTASIRYGKALNMAGGGPFSARMTAPLCIAGGIALQLLQKSGITIGAHIKSIADIEDLSFDTVNLSSHTLNNLKSLEIATLSDEIALKMKEKINFAMNLQDSLGGIIEAVAVNLPAGIGGAMYDGIESFISPIVFGIPAVKGLEFGAGFNASKLTGSVNNDPFYYDEKGNIKTETNNCGGILGGITTGMPLIMRVAFKPTPSITKEQRSVDLQKKENTVTQIIGRHDPCVAVRAVPIVEAALALGILDCMMEVSK